MQEVGTLSVVGTPIGNLGDITLRALATLKDADVVVAEDTRVSSKLLTRYDIKKPLLSYHAQSARRAAERILTLLGEGKRIALVTDAGTPGISDPGVELVALVRDRLPDVRIETIPGPSALTAALSIAGIPAASFVFVGFLPHKKGRQTLLAAIAKEGRAVVFYESPHRIEKTLGSLSDLLPKTRHIALLREMTKLHEEVLHGSVQEVTSRLLARGEESRRGEYVVVVAPA